MGSLVCCFYFSARPCFLPHLICFSPSFYERDAQRERERERERTKTHKRRREQEEEEEGLAREGMDVRDMYEAGPPCVSRAVDGFVRIGMVTSSLLFSLFISLSAASAPLFFTFSFFFSSSPCLLS